MYQQVNLADHTLVGPLGPLPTNLVGLPDTTVADISATCNPPPPGMAGQGWWPVVIAAPASFDPTQQTPASTHTYTVDLASRSVTGTPDLRTATSAEAASALATLQSTKLSALTVSCVATIVGGYPSSALGPVHTYPSKPTDQTNMLGSVTASLFPNLPANWTTPFWVADASGVWSFADHTASQIQQAGSDGKAAVAGAQLKLASLSAEVAAAKSQADLDKITW